MCKHPAVSTPCPYCWTRRALASRSCRIFISASNFHCSHIASAPLTALWNALSSISDAFQAANACTSTHEDPLPNRQQSGQAFAIVSASGTVHMPHFDPNGQITFLHIREGFKMFVVGVYQEKLSKLPKFPNCRVDLWALLRMLGMRICVAVAGPGSTMYAFSFFLFLIYIIPYTQRFFVEYYPSAPSMPLQHWKN